MPADRHHAVLVASDVAAGEREVQDHLHGVGAERVLRDAHAPDEHGVLRVADQLGELLNARAAEPGLSARSRGQSMRGELRAHCVESAGVLPR